MCGIAGFVGSGLGDEAAGALLRQMTERIRHRGPDDDGFWRGDDAGLGMRRLSIIDVQGGQQPITNEDGSVVVVFNGEIYNYPTLRRELEASGHTFATQSDTETIVHAYEENGLDFVQRLRGMFAIALWDRRRQRLILTCDRFGEKPLHYALRGRGLVFGSEIKSLLVAPEMPRELDPLAITQYFTFGYIPAPRTAFQGIQKLPPATTLVFEDGRVQLQRYWQLDFTPRCPDDEATAAEHIRHLLTEAVRLHMHSDVPLGAFLSGGIDSSAVVATMAGLSSQRVKTFSIGFDEQTHSELPYARLIASRYHTDHHELTIRMNLLDILPNLIWDFDEPFADSSMVPTYYVSRLTRERVTVALSGDGGDELFGGYNSYTRALLTESLAHTLGPARSIVSRLGALLPDGTRGKPRLRALACDPAENFVETQSIFPSDLRARLLEPGFVARNGANDPCHTVLELFAEAQALDLYPRMQHVDVECSLPNDMLVKVDRASMFASLETRAPLLDHVLAEYVASLSPRVRTRGARKKHIFKLAVNDLLPEEITGRAKQGFSIPLKQWLRDDLKTLVWDVLQSRAARNRGVVNPREVERLLSEHQSRGQDHAKRIWAWLCFELWATMYLDGTPASFSSPPQGYAVRQPARTM